MTGAQGRGSEFGDEGAAAQRERMVSRQIAGRGIANPYVIGAMREVPREFFVPSDLARFAYADTPLPIGGGQTISQPYIVAMMLDAAGIAPGEKVLDVGTGSGYAAAVASRIADKVISIERRRDLAEGARRAIDALAYDNIDIRIGDGTRGAPEEAPFDVILVSAAGPCIPQDLIDQLPPGGRLIIPVGTARPCQHLMRVRRTGDGNIEQDDLGPVAFVPLIGARGWRDPT